MKTKHPVHIRVFGMVTSNGNVMPPFIFPHGLNMGAYIKSLGEVVPWMKRVAAGRSCIWHGNRTLHHAKKAGKFQFWMCENFCNHITPNIWLPNSPDCNLFDYCVRCCWVRDQQNSVQHHRWTENKDNGTVEQFKQGDYQKALQEIPVICGYLFWINLIYSISRDFHVNASGELSMLFLFLAI